MNSKIPKVIAFVNQKGGCGKTSTAINALYWFRQQGYSVIMVDADQQRSSARTAKELEIPYIEIFDASELSKSIPRLQQEYDLVIVDGPASISEINRTILMEANLAIIPCKTSAYDVESAEKTIDFLVTAQRVCRRPPVGVVFLNDVNDNSILLREAEQYFSDREDGIVLLQQSIPHRVCIGDIGTQNQSVFQMSGRSAKEVAMKYERLFRQALEVFNELDKN